MQVLRELVFDCAHPARLARFWASVLDGFEVRAYDSEELARLAELGLTPETDTVVMVDGPDLKLCFQRSEPTGGSARNRIHLDVVADDRAALVRRLRDQGAAVVQEFADHTWMRDPEGNDLCITDPR